MSDKIYIYKAKKDENYFRFRTKSEFFNEAIRAERDGDYLIFTHAGLDDAGKKVIRPRYDAKIKRFVFGLVVEEFNSFKVGHYAFDEDSNEDEIIIYLG